MILTFENVTLKYGPSIVLDDINVKLQSGGLIGLVGPNGAGKSTFIKLIATLLRPTEGRILLDNQDIVQNPGIMRRNIGYLPQEVAVYPELTPMEFLSYMAAVKGLPRRAAAKQAYDLLELLHIGDTGRKQIGDFSGGMRQRVGIACALLGDPKIIVVDEPAAGLDPQERVTLRNLLSELAAERIVLFSTHIVSDVEAVASDLILLQKGKLLYHGAPGKMIEMTDGHVWKFNIQSTKMLPHEITISSLIHGAHGLNVRAVSAEKPAENALPVEATLEDACLLFLKGGAI